MGNPLSQILCEKTKLLRSYFIVIVSHQFVQYVNVFIYCYCSSSGILYFFPVRFTHIQLVNSKIWFEKFFHHYFAMAANKMTKRQENIVINFVAFLTSIQNSCDVLTSLSFHNDVTWWEFPCSHSNLNI